jgi:hypothetical protein
LSSLWNTITEKPEELSITFKKLGILMTSINLAGSVIGMGNLEFPFFVMNWGIGLTLIFFMLSF